MQLILVDIEKRDDFGDSGDRLPSLNATSSKSLRIYLKVFKVSSGAISNVIGRSASSRLFSPGECRNRITSGL